MLFTEYKIGTKKTKNRLVRSATNDHLSHMDGTVSEESILLYETLARSEVGTIITGHFAVSEQYKTAPNQPLLTDDRFIASAKRIPDAVHKFECIVIAQISHGGLNAYNKEFDVNKVSYEELHGTIDEFASAALRAKKAGFDGVQVHLAHGYLLANVLDNTVNKRTDIYGGSRENRFILIKEIILAIRERCGDDFTVLVKLSVNNMELSSYKEELNYYAKQLELCGVDAIELSGSEFMKHEKGDKKYYLQEAVFVKGNINLPVILVGGMSNRNDIEEALASGIDMIALSRAFICEPDYAITLKNNYRESKCIRCFSCLKIYKSLFKNCIFHSESEQLKELYLK